jgi:hypothetical protein
VSALRDELQDVGYSFRLQGLENINSARCTGIARLCVSKNTNEVTQGIRAT